METAHFILSFLTGTRAEQDIDFLAANAEKSFAAIAATIGGSLEAPMRFLKNSGEAGQDKRKIAVFFHGNKQAMQQRTKSNGLGITNFGATIDDEQSVRLTCEINVVYTNPFALAIVAHEVAHAALLLGSFKLEAIQGNKIEGQKGLAKAFFAGYRRIPAFLQEGIGDHAAYYQGFLGKWPLLPDIGQLLRPVLGSGSYIPLEQLIDAHPAIVVKKHKYFSLLAASFIDFLIQEYGVGKMRAWLLAGNEKGRETFASIYGEDVRAVEKKWLASLT